MCILLMIPSKTQKPGEELLAQCWRSNPDGAGIMYPDKAASKLVVSKGHMDLAALVAAFSLVPEGVPVSVHFRIKTHGLKDAANTHPHWVWPDEVAIAHNGILPIGAPTESTESDTARFARLVLPHLPRTWWKNPALVHLVEEYMGRSNKMVTMNQAGDYKILNEELGTWENGVWFSNQTFRTSRTYSPSSYTTYGVFPYDDDSIVGGQYGGYQAGVKVGSQVAASGPAGGSTDTGAGIQVKGADETQIITPVGADEPVDPLVLAIVDGVITESDRKILETDIGCMSNQEFTRYEEIMEAMYG